MALDAVEVAGVGRHRDQADQVSVRFIMDVGEVLLRRNQATEARRRAARTWPASVCFAVGAAAGAASFAAAGLWSLALPAGLALLALAIGLGDRLDGERRRRAGRPA